MIFVVRYEDRSLVLDLRESVWSMDQTAIETAFGDRIGRLEGRLLSRLPADLRAGQLFLISSRGVAARFRLLSSQGDIVSVGSYSLPARDHELELHAGLIAELERLAEENDRLHDVFASDLLPDSPAARALYEQGRADGLAGRWQPR